MSKSNWLVRCARDWLKPVYDELHRELLESDVIHADETEVQVLHEPGKTPPSKKVHVAVPQRQI